MRFFINGVKQWFTLPSWKQIFIALIAGIVTGIFAGKYTDYIKPMGSLFINAIHMIVAPVIFTAIVTAILSIKEKSNVRRMTMRAICLYILFMLISASLGCLLAYFIEPGRDFPSLILSHGKIPDLGSAPTVLSFIEHLLPSNPVVPFLEGNVLQLILFAILFASAIKLAGHAAEPVARFFLSLNKVVYQITAIVIWFAPYGIFALIAWTVGNFGLSVIMPLLVLVGTVYSGCLCLLFVVYPAALYFFAKKQSPVQFYRSIFPALAFAFTSSSSAATLPLTIRCCEDNLGLPSHVTKFLLPLGASFNLNGLSLYLSVATVFAANLYGIHLGIVEYLTIVVTITITAMGAAAVP